MTALGEPRAVRPLADLRELTQQPVRSFLPWTSESVIRWLVAQTVAIACIVAGWFAVSGSLTLGGQTGWLKLGVAGLALSGAANGLWLLSGRQMVGRARVAVLRLPHAAHTIVDAQSDRHVTVPGTARFHRIECQLVSGKPTVAVDDHAALVPCELCRP